MKIAVTGATGHIGNNLCRELIRRGYPVRALVRSDDPALAGLNLTPFRGDLTDSRSVASLVRDTEVVFHLAAHISVNGNKAAPLEETNVRGTRIIVEESMKAGVRRFVHFSSIHALVQQPYDQPLDESRPLALNDPMPYASSKAKAEKMVLNAITQGLDAVVLSPTSVVGPHDYKPSLMGSFLWRLSRNRMPVLVRGGYDFVDVRDVVDAAVRSIDQGKTGERYLLAGRWESLQDLARLVAASVPGVRVPLVVPMWVAYAGLPVLRGAARLMGERVLYTREALDAVATGHRNIHSGKAGNDLDFKPRPLQETVADTLNWFQSHYRK